MVEQSVQYQNTSSYLTNSHQFPYLAPIHITVCVDGDRESNRDGYCKTCSKT
uniref:Uncharacterized protein n=1 Tax=Rhizophora mucronata TaxID=61149 RepID=A0A2P2P8Z0_RHIMU